MSEALKPGQDSIDTCSPTQLKDGTWRLQWKFCFQDGTCEGKTTKGKTERIVRRRAREKADELRELDNAHLAWTGKRKIKDFIKQVSIPAVEADKKLEPGSKRQYLRNLGYLAEEFKNTAIANVTPKAIQNVLNTIAQKHGTETAKQCRKVLNGRVMKKLVFEQAIKYNPLDHTDIEVTVEVRKAGHEEPMVALTREEYDRAYAYVLAADPTDPEYTKPHGYTRDKRILKRRTYIDITILQMATGLRIDEVLSLTRDDVLIDGDEITLRVIPEDSKTHKGRRIRILRADCAQRFLERFNALDPRATYVYHTPLNPLTRYRTDNGCKAVNKFLHEEIAKKCDIKTFETQGSHTWRITLNTFAKSKGVPTEIRSAYFGHGEEVNEAYYTDEVDVSPFVEVMFE